MQSQKLEFEGATGEALSAQLDFPAGEEPIAFALFAHCFTCSKNYNAEVNVARALNRERIAVLRFDFTGLGESEGEFAETNFTSNIGDLVAAARFLEREYEAPRILIGHSLGGAAALRAAREIPSAAAVVTIAAPYDPAHIANLFAGSLDRIEQEGEARIEIAGRPFRITRQLVDDLSRAGTEGILTGLGRGLLIFHSPADEVVSIDNAAKIYTAAPHPKSFISLGSADHLISDEADSRYVGAVLAAWATRYIESPQPETVEQLREEERVVAVTAAGGFRTEITTRGHGLVADEPVALGGMDLGPSPYDLLAAALGACTTMTVRMYADRKQWPLEEVSARLHHTKVHAEDEEKIEGEEPARLDHIDRELTLTGDLDEKQRARLLEIAERCPVHRTLAAGVDVTTRLV
ncbi:MAG: bifunctional alpha/beta hydrolase/OsmC family protein [Gemmatimonadaceae bacterium]